MSKEDEARNQSNDNRTKHLNGHSDLYPKHREDNPDFFAIFLVGLIGATFTTAVVTRYRRTVHWAHSQPNRSYSSWYGYSGRSSRTSFQEKDAWTSRYQRRLQEEMEEETERVERIRRMQEVFNRQRDKYKRSNESWSESDTGEYHQHYQRNDWYWKREKSYRDSGTKFREAPRASENYSLSHHYSILGLDRWRTKPYTDEEIKSAFRLKAKEFHPDQNQENKESAEAKFKEIMVSYEALKSEKKNNQSR